jgi:hypothetical protein
VTPLTPAEPQEPVRAGRDAEVQMPTGPAAAALLAAAIGALTLGGATLLAGISQPFDHALADAGRLLLPGGAHVGRLGGQELVALVAWLASWALLHVRLRGRQVEVGGVAAILVCALVLATLLLWPPIGRALATLVR